MVTDEALQVHAPETGVETVHMTPFRPPRKEALLEVSVFLFLVVPSMVLLSAVIFALGHGYEGSMGVVTVGIMGLTFNLIYLWRKSLITPIVLHFLQDFIAIVVVRYLQGAPSA